MSSPFQLETSRLLLRLWQERDREPFAAMNADPGVMRFFAATRTRVESDEDIHRYLEQFERDGFTMFAAELREDGAFAGVIGIQVMRDPIPNLPQPAVEIGWRLTQDCQSKGLATEAARAIVDLAFNQLNLAELVAITVPVNTASRRVMEKLGMAHRPELTFDHPRVPAEHPHKQHVLYSLPNPASVLCHSSDSKGYSCAPLS